MKELIDSLDPRVVAALLTLSGVLIATAIGFCTALFTAKWQRGLAEDQWVKERAERAQQWEREETAREEQWKREGEVRFRQQQRVAFSNYLSLAMALCQEIQHSATAKKQPDQEERERVANTLVELTNFQCEIIILASMPVIRSAQAYKNAVSDVAIAYVNGRPINHLLETVSEKMSQFVVDVREDLDIKNL